MSLSVDLLRALGEVLQEEAGRHKPHSDPWAIFQDAADALADLADYLAEANG